MYPVCIFAYKRKFSLERLIKSLQENPESINTDIYIFCDNAKNTKDTKDVQNVREYCKSINGFKSITIKESFKNQGLAKSVINGITEITRSYDAVIVLEDDLIVSRGFLSFMNSGLTKYKNDKKVMSVCGFSKKIPGFLFNRKQTSFFHKRSSSWGWATWKDRWDIVDFDRLTKINSIDKILMYIRVFFISPDLPLMINAQRKHKINSWAIRFVEAQSRLNLYSLFPKHSLVENIGFDDEATNCDVDLGFDSDFNSFNESQIKYKVKKHSFLINIYLWFYELYFGLRRVISRSLSKSLKDDL